MTNDNCKPSDVAWSKQLFNSLKDGGAWGVPRSGLFFTRRGERFELTARLPYDPAMPMSETQMREFQASDFECIKRNFGAAGIAVIDAIQTSKE
jgi:hypothetical protein